MNKPIIDLYVPVTVSSEDKSKYGRVMSNWTYLSAYMCVNDPQAETIGLLIRLELNGRKRKDILDRLVSRLTSCIRQQLKQEMLVMHERGNG